MIKSYARLLDFFGRLLIWPLKRPLRRIHRHLDRILLERPGFWGDQWRLFHRPDWQRSAKFNTRMWVTGFALFYPLARQIGHSWWINLGVTLGLDLGVYLWHKQRLWPERTTGYARSYAPWGCFWGMTFLINLGAAWVLLDQVQLERGLAKGVLGVVGVLVNPWVFRFRDRVALRDRPTKIGTA